jgi:very-short-patch-repair endonuclease
LTDDVPWTQSEAESRFLELIAAAGLPAPRVNQLIDGMTVDCVWPDRRLIIEVDGWRWHRLRRDFENDRRRDARLQIAGWRVVRFTAARIRDDPEALIGELRALLA